MLEPDARVVMRSRAEESDYSVIAIGSFLRPGWSLVKSGKPIKIRPDGKFGVEIPIRDQRAEFELMAVGPAGEVEKQRFEARIHAWKELQSAMAKRHFMSASLAPTLLQYRETGVPAFSQIALTAKASYQYLLKPPAMDFGITAYATLAKLSSSPSDSQARSIGLNVRAGYAPPFFQEPWRVSILGGFYYTTMLVTENRFGFSNLMGPQFFPVVRRAFRSGDTLGGYFKFSPIGSSLSLLRLSNNETATGIAYTHQLPNRHPLIIGLDLSRLSLEIQGIRIESKNFSLGVGYGW